MMSETHANNFEEILPCSKTFPNQLALVPLKSQILYLHVGEYFHLKLTFEL